MEPVLKTGGQKCLVGSNPTPSAPTTGHPTTERNCVSDDIRHHSRRSRHTPTIARHGRLRRQQPDRHPRQGPRLEPSPSSSSAACPSPASRPSASPRPSQPTCTWLEPPRPRWPRSRRSAPSTAESTCSLVGSDSRKGQDPAFGGEDETGDLNDVTMLLHISQDHSNVTVVSFPRDMFVSIPSCPDPDGGSFDSMIAAEDQHHAHLRRARLHGPDGREAHRPRHPVRGRDPVQRRDRHVERRRRSSRLRGGADRGRVHRHLPRPRHAHAGRCRRPAVPAHPSRRRRRQRPDPHLATSRSSCRRSCARSRAPTRWRTR